MLHDKEGLEQRYAGPAVTDVAGDGTSIIILVEKKSILGYLELSIFKSPHFFQALLVTPVNSTRIPNSLHAQYMHAPAPLN